MTSSLSSSSRVCTIILAAGGSTRLGTPKQLLPFRNHSLLRHVAEEALASRTHSCTVVLGAKLDKIRPELSGLDLRILENPIWSEGIASSLRLGINSLPKSEEGALILLCDQPMLSKGLINSMIEKFLFSGKPIVACEYGGGVGVPALFARSFFPQLLSLKGDKGAKQILKTNLENVVLLPFPEGNVDIDTPADLANLRES